MKKKLLATIMAVSVLAAAGLTTALCVNSCQQQAGVQENQVSGSYVTDENGDVMGNEVNAMPARMVFRSTKALADQNEYEGVTIQATIKPDNATNKNVSWDVEFVNPESVWAKGKNISDYISLTPQADGSNIATVECLQPFGEQIKITVTSVVNTSAKAECKVDFAKRILNVPIDVRDDANDFHLGNMDFTMDKMYLDVGVNWGLLWENPAVTYTDYTVDDTFDVIYEIYANEDVVSQFNDDTGLNAEVATLGMSGALNAISGPLSYTLDGIDWSNLEAANKLNDWLANNSDKAMFTLHYKAVGKYSTYEADIPIYVTAGQLDVIVTEIILNPNEIVF